MKNSRINIGIRRRFVWLALLLILTPALMVYAQQASGPSFTHDTLSIQSDKKIWKFSIEVARTPEQQEYGLMFRHTLDSNKGMLFLSDTDHDTRMWMKNTLIPLDMVFIDSSGRIVYIAQNATPESLDVISAGQKVRAVLELAGGITQKDHLQSGDRVLYPAFVSVKE